MYKSPRNPEDSYPSLFPDCQNACIFFTVVYRRRGNCGHWGRRQLPLPHHKNPAVTCFLFYLQTYRTHQASPQHAAGTENNWFQLAEHFLPLHHLHSGTAPGPQKCVCLWLVPTTGSSTLKLRKDKPSVPQSCLRTWRCHSRGKDTTF